MNDATAKLIRKLKDGNGVYMWQPALTGGQPDLLMNKPVEYSASMPVIAATAKAIAFANLADYYWIADRQGMVLQRLNELYANNDQIGFKGTKRVDGKLILAEAAKLLVMHA
jgi:HK97 family phage major capsid protein